MGGLLLNPIAVMYISLPRNAGIGINGVSEMSARRGENTAKERSPQRDSITLFFFGFTSYHRVLAGNGDDARCSR
jgi:hypothetical protein